MTINGESKQAVPKAIMSERGVPHPTVTTVETHAEDGKIAEVNPAKDTGADRAKGTEANPVNGTEVDPASDTEVVRATNGEVDQEIKTLNVGKKPIVMAIVKGVDHEAEEADHPKGSETDPDQVPRVIITEIIVRNLPVMIVGIKVDRLTPETRTEIRKNRAAAASRQWRTIPNLERSTPEK